MVVDTAVVENAALVIEPLRVTRNGKRFFSKEHKRAVIERCLAPGASVAGVALAHGLNANLVRRWIDRHRTRSAKASRTTKLVQVKVSPQPHEPLSLSDDAKPQARGSTASSSTGSIEIEIAGARLLLRGAVDVEQLRLVLEMLIPVR